MYKLYYMLAYRIGIHVLIYNVLWCVVIVAVYLLVAFEHSTSSLHEAGARSTKNTTASHADTKNRVKYFVWNECRWWKYGIFCIREFFSHYMYIFIFLHFYFIYYSCTALVYRGGWGEQNWNGKVRTKISDTHWNGKGPKFQTHPKEIAWFTFRRVVFIIVRSMLVNVLLYYVCSFDSNRFW